MAQYIYTTPAGTRYNLFTDMLNQNNLLIAGMAGSGKSVLENGLIAQMLLQPPCDLHFYLIDLKRVELGRYRNLPHCKGYADDVQSALSMLRNALDIIDSRYREMAAKGIQKYDGGTIYIVIDEMAELMTVAKREVTPLIQRICQIGRASRVKLIACTQCPLSSVIPTAIKVNFDGIVGLHTRSAQDSRNILGMNGCETLPRYGECIFQNPADTCKYIVPFVETAELDRLCAHWMDKNNWHEAGWSETTGSELLTKIKNFLRRS